MDSHKPVFAISDQILLLEGASLIDAQHDYFPDWSAAMMSEFPQQISWDHLKLLYSTSRTVASLPESEREQYVLKLCVDPSEIEHFKKCVHCRFSPCPKLHDYEPACERSSVLELYNANAQELLAAERNKQSKASRHFSTAILLGLCGPVVVPIIVLVAFLPIALLGGFIPLVVIPIIAFITVIVQVWLVHRAGTHFDSFYRLRQPNAWIALLHEREPPILYLRSFVVDANAPSSGAFSLSVEEKLAVQCSRAGPMIAIGRPSEPLPALGSMRLYVNDSEWQATVVRLLRISGIVILRLGSTAGTFWELKTALSELECNKLIIWSVDGFHNLPDCVKETIPGLPDSSQSYRFLCHDSQGAPHYCNNIKQALRILKIPLRRMTPREQVLRIFEPMVLVVVALIAVQVVGFVGLFLIPSYIGLAKYLFGTGRRAYLRTYPLTLPASPAFVRIN